MCHFGTKFYHINPNDNFAIISTNEDELNIRDINVLLSTILSKKLNLTGKSFLHCSAVEKENGASVMIGDPGAGKTSLAVYLCRYFDYNLICNDHAIVGIENENIPYFYSGTLRTALRPGAVNLVAPELLNNIPSKMLDNPWKVQFELNKYFDDLGIKIGNATFIKNIFFVNVNEKIPSHCKKFDFNKSYNRELLKIYDFLGEFTRSNGKFLFGINRIFPNFDNEETDSYRQNLVTCLVEKINIYEISGNIQYVASKINDLYFNMSK